MGGSCFKKIQGKKKTRVYIDAGLAGRRYDQQNVLVKSSFEDTWRIIPFSKWLITMVIVSPLTGVVPFTNGRYLWLINGGDPNYLQVTGMILQVDGDHLRLPFGPVVWIRELLT